MKKENSCTDSSKKAQQKYDALRAKTKQDYENAVNNYLLLFCEKHDFDYEDAANDWVSGDVGGVTLVGDFFVDMQTILADINLNAPEKEFVRWYDYCLRLYSLGSDISTPNFENWVRGCPRKSEQEIQKLELLHDQAIRAEQTLRDAIDEEKKF